MTQDIDRGEPRPPASTGRRVVALAVDWLACSLIAAAFLGYRWRSGGLGGFAPLAVLAVENVLLVGTLGATLGHRLTGIGVRRGDDALPGPGAALVRTLLLCLAVPALLTGRDGRRLHDVAAGTRVVRTG